MKKIIIKLLLICYLSATTLAVNAIDLEITNASISPNPLVANMPYVISATFENLSGASSPQDAQLVVVSITGFNPTNIDIGSPIAANPTGWGCAYDATFNSIDCSKIFNTGDFSPGTTQAFSVQINPGSTVLNPDNFHIEMVDDILGDETFPNQIDVPVGGAPSLSFTSGSVAPDVTIGVETTAVINYQITNVSAANVLKDQMDLFVSYDAPDFAFDATVTNANLPVGWSCNNANPLVCTHTGGGNLVTSGVINFPLTFNIAQPPNPPTVGNHNFDATTHLASVVEDTQTITLNVLSAPAPPNLQFDAVANPTPITVLASSASVPFSIINNDVIATAFEGDVALKVTFGPEFTLNSSTPTVLPSSNWTCSGTTSPIICSCLNATLCASGIITGQTFDFDLSFNTVASVTQAGNYPFQAEIIYQNDAANPLATTTQNLAVNLIPTNLSILKSSTDSSGALQNTFNSGDNFTYKLTVANSGNDIPANQIVVNDTLPLNVDFVSVPVLAGWTCTSSGVGGRVIECINTGAVLISGTSVVIDIPVIAGNTVGSFDNTATVGINPLVTAIIDDIDTSGVNVDSQNVTINAPAAGAVNITKTASSPTYTVGDNVVYTILVENTTAALSVLDMEINDVLPIANLDAATVSVNATTLVGSSTYSCSFDAVDTVSCANTSTLPFVIGDKLEVIISVDASTAGTNISNIATATSLQLGSLGSSLPAVISINSGTPIIQPTSLSVQKSVSQNGVQVSEIEKGSSFQYEVVVTNTGNSALYSFSVIDSMPQGVVVDNIVTPVGMTCNNQGQTYSCNYPQPLATNSSLQIIYQVTDASDANTTSLLNTVRVVSFNAQEKSDEALVILTGSNPNPNPNPNNNYTLEIKDDVDPVQQGEDFNYTVTLKNTGSVALNAIDINLMLPPELQVNSTQTNGVSCSTVSTGLHCIASGGLVVNAGQQLDILTVNVVSNDFFGDVLAQVIANNTGSTSISADETTTILEHIIIPKTDLSVTVGNTQIANQGGQTSFDVRVENLAASAIKPRLQVSLSGLIDATQVSANEFWDCDVAGVNVSCVYRGASMPSGQVTSIQFNLVLTQISVEAENIVVVASIESDTEDEFIANNTTTATINVNPTPTEGEILSALRSALDGKANQQVNRAIQNVASYCEVSYFMALEGMCEDLYQSALNGDGETINTVMEQIIPNEVIGQSTSIAEIATAQFRNIGSRLSQLRAGGGSGFSSAGLNATYGNGSLPLGMLAYLNKSVDESSNIDVNNDFISPWGFFVNGTISMGTRDATGRELGFDFDSYGLTAGVDYRLSANKVVGVALGYANFDSDIDGQAKLKSTGVTLTGYGSFYVNDNFYVDARISVAKPDFDQSRKIEFTLGDTTVSRVANGSTSSNQYSVAMSAGYNFYKNSWNITPNGSFRYIKTSIDGFTETGAGGFNFNYSNQDLESMIWSAGIRVSKAISLKNGVITPQFDFDYNYESLNDGNDIEARFVTAPLNEVFIIETDSPDRTYGSAGLGFAYISSNGKQAYINYRSVLGLEGFSRGTFNLGARFEF